MAEDHRTEEISRALVRIKTNALAMVCAIIGGTGLFVMTAWLLIKDGEHVGQHLQLLSNYFVGYSVTWGGSAIGFIYGAIVGWAVGWMIGAVYNKVVNLRHG